jgi:phospholipase/carboxylesterase
MTLAAHIIEPEEKHSSSIIWLHGLGADGHDFAAVAPVLNLLETRFVFPHAPVRSITANNGYPMRGWYDIVTLDRDNFVHDVEGVRASSDFVLALIEAEHQKGIPYEKIILAGFSQGGAIALFAGLTTPHSIAGILALSTYLPAPEVLQTEAKATPRNILMLHGTKDNIIPLASAEASIAWLKKIGQHPEFKVYPMAHSMCESEVNDITLWLNKVLI